MSLVRRSLLLCLVLLVACSGSTLDAAPLNPSPAPAPAPSPAPSPAPAALPSTGEAFGASVEFSVPLNTTMGMDDLFSPYANVKGDSFFVWVDDDFRPQVTQKTSHGVLTSPLDANPDYHCFHEGHHRFSLGIDKNGYIHVTGDMHHYPSGPDSNAHMPARYRNQAIMYWVSNAPYDVSQGFTFVGGRSDTRAIHTGGIVYSRFFHDRHGELYWTAMVHAVDDNFEFLQGQMGLALHKYNPGPAQDPRNGTWTALGGLATPSNHPSNPVPFNKVIFWADAGNNSGPGGVAWFQGFQSAFQFDRANNLHFASAVVPDPSNLGNTRAMYAMSPDGGLTWKRANGSAIAGLPLRGEDSSPNVADVVLDTHGTRTIGDYVAVTADASGAPAVWADNTWRRWDGSHWTTDSSDHGNTVGGRAYLGADGRMTFLEGNVIWLHRLQTLAGDSASYQLQNYVPASNLHFFSWISDLGLYSTGALWGVGTNDSDQKTFQIVKASFTPAPLPAGWGDQDIGAPPNRGGSTAYSNGGFTLRGGAPGLGGSADRFHFTYQALNGDGSIVARVVSQGDSFFDPNDGVMLRDSLDANAKFVALGQAVKSGTHLSFRSTTAGTMQDTGVGSPGPRWIKVVRQGQTFTGYRSADGASWQAVGQSQTIPMNASIYVGLMAGGSNNYDVHEAKVDNVTVTGGAPPVVAGACKRADPTLSVVPSVQTLVAGKSGDYRITTTNRDSAGCDPAAFTLFTNVLPGTPGATNAIAAQISPRVVTVAPGGSVTSGLHLQVGGATSMGAYTTWVSTHNNASGRESLAASKLNVRAK